MNSNQAPAASRGQQIRNADFSQQRKLPSCSLAKALPSKLGAPPLVHVQTVQLSWLAGVFLATAGVLQAAAASALEPIVEIEEEVYRYEPANNGAGPLWCSGSTCLARIGEDVFASGLETLKEGKPLNNCRWLLFKRESTGWQLQQADPRDRTREPSPLAAFPDGRLFLSVNPTLTGTQAYGGPARPEILQFSAKNPKAAADAILPVWEGTPGFTEHSYRSFAADGPNRELILFQNVGDSHSEWTFRDRSGKWSAQGKLQWPDGKEYPKAEPVRVCYPDVALKNRAVYFCGVSDIIEPYPEWRVFKQKLTGQNWDYDFRRLFYTWTPDITHTHLSPWIEIASRDKTCGWISPGDLSVAPDGTVWLVWPERASDERQRAKVFPEARQSHSLNYAEIRDGKVTLRRTLVIQEEGKPGLIASAPRWHRTPDQRLLLVFYVQGTDGNRQGIAENRIMEIRPGGETGVPVKLPLKQPFTSYFTATPRAGSPESNTIEFLGQRAGSPSAMSYARLRLQ